MIAADLIAAAARAAFLTVAAPVAGVVPMLAIARVTGADWRILAPLARALPWLVPAGALLGVVQLASPAPTHLAVWMHPLAVAARAVLAAALLAWAGRRLASGANVTFAAITLAVYAVLVTPIAADWMLGQSPGHPVSAIGMMLFVQQVAGLAAWVLLGPAGTSRLRGDMARLGIAAALGLGYLGFMDYLVIWYGNLPERVGFYLLRGGWPGASLVVAALAVGIALPIALLAPVRSPARERWAGIAILVGLSLFNTWWTGGGWLALPIVVLLAILPLRRLGRPA